MSQPDDRPPWAPRPRRRRRPRPQPQEEFGGPLPLHDAPPPPPAVHDLPPSQRYGSFQNQPPHGPIIHDHGGGDMLAGRGARLAASIIDGIAVFIAILPGFGAFMATMSAGMDPEGGPPDASGGGAGLILMLLCLLGLAGYQLYLLTTQGQTIGKKLMKIRIVRYDDGMLPGFVKAVLLRSFVPSMIGQFVPFFGLIDVLFIFGAEQRCIHDLIAGTKVVEANPGFDAHVFD